jgi:hypothetical protein
MSAEQNTNSQDYELLSAYIDGELTDDERTALEQRLAKESFLQRELDLLRTTVALIHYLQPMTAPRNFTLTDEMVNASKVIQFKPRRRIRTEYLSLVASVVLMLFGVIFMLSEINEPQGFSADASSFIQSDSSAEKNTAPQIANAPTSLATGADLQMERMQEEPDALDAVTVEEVEEAPAEANAVLNQQAPSDDESVTDADTEIRQESFEGGGAGSASDGVMFSVEAPSATENLASASSDIDNDGYVVAGETQLLEVIPEEDTIAQDAPQPMTGGTGGGFSEAEALSDTTTTGNEVSDGNDTIAEPVDDEARNDEPAEGIGRLVSPATEIPPSPQPPPSLQVQDEATPTQALNNAQIGVGLLIVGLLLLITSMLFIRRNRS